MVKSKFLLIKARLDHTKKFLEIKVKLYSKLLVVIVQLCLAIHTHDNPVELIVSDATMYNVKGEPDLVSKLDLSGN